MTSRCEACDPPRKGLRTWALVPGANTPETLLTLCNAHWHMAKIMGIKHLIYASPVLAKKINAALGREG